MTDSYPPERQPRYETYMDTSFLYHSALDLRQKGHNSAGLTLYLNERPSH